MPSASPTKRTLHAVRERRGCPFLQDLQFIWCQLPVLVWHRALYVERRSYNAQYTLDLLQRN